MSGFSLAKEMRDASLEFEKGRVFQIWEVTSFLQNLRLQRKLKE